ncbi:unnamed protein product [Fraxinus pennsylvanica]|uniref:EF-hand domain-containing protein n=1 Tax=Fraxinus pennsylvanica TaxID=56036 RepID=A0AAD2A5K1_9LAMI|nr:unnamed protein product [Fraxinus pennsylvanica]
MIKIAFISLFLLLGSHLAYSRSIKEDLNFNPISDGVDSFRNSSWGLSLSATTESCQPVYGILPCSSNVWGLLFLIVIYEILLSVAERYVANGSEQFFEIIGPGGIFGASLFQFLGTIPQIIIVLVSALSGTTEAAQQRAKLGMGMVAGSTVMFLTLIWGTCVLVGSYDLSEATPDNTGNQRTLKGFGVVTDVQTIYTARIMLITLVPLVILQLESFFHSSGKQVVTLIALIITMGLLIGYILYQIFQPWIQNRRFELLMYKYAKDKLLTLLTRNGRPDTQKIQQLFNKVDRNNNGSVSAAELRVLFLGLRSDNDLSTDKDVEDIMASFDITGDAGVNRDEFVTAMTKLVNDLSNKTRDPKSRNAVSSNTKNTSAAQQSLLANNTTPSTTPAPTPGTKTSNVWVTFFRAAFFFVVGTGMLLVLAEPLIQSVVTFSEVVNLSSFAVSYLAIPFAMNYRVAVASIGSARQKTENSISLTLSSLYGGVYMNNVIGLIAFLAPVYFRNLSSDISAEVAVLLVVCILMTLFTSFSTTFPRWTSYIVLLLYPISLASVYVLTSVFGWS